MGLSGATHAPHAYVVTGAWVAPAYRIQTAVILVILLAMALAASITYVASNGEFPYGGWGWLELGALVVLWVGGTITGVYYVNEQERP